MTIQIHLLGLVFLEIIYRQGQSHSDGTGVKQWLLRFLRRVKNIQEFFLVQRGSWLSGRHDILEHERQ
jgi:hypothetical protein